MAFVADRGQLGPAELLQLSEELPDSDSDNYSADFTTAKNFTVPSIIPVAATIPATASR